MHMPKSKDLSWCCLVASSNEVQGPPGQIFPSIILSNAWFGQVSFMPTKNPYCIAQILPGDCVKNLTGSESAIWLSHLILSSSQITGVSKKSLGM